MVCQEFTSCFKFVWKYKVQRSEPRSLRLAVDYKLTTGWPHPRLADGNFPWHILVQTSSVTDVEKGLSLPPPSQSTHAYPHSQVFPLCGFDCKNREIKPEDFYPVNSLNVCLRREREGEGEGWMSLKLFISWMIDFRSTGVPSVPKVWYDVFFFSRWDASWQAGAF